MIRAIVGTAVVIAAYSGAWLLTSTPREWGYALLLGATAVFAVVFRRPPGSNGMSEAGASSFPPSTAASSRRTAGVLAATLLASGAATYILARLVRTDSARGAQIALWLGSLTIFAIGSSLADRKHTPSGRVTTPAKRWEVALATLILAAGIALRVAALDAYPTGSHGDEGEVGLEAVRILHGAGPGPFGVAWLMHPGLFFYIEALFIGVFGPTLTAIRLVSALSGAALLFFVFAFSRLSFGPRIALLATALNAVSAIDIQFSRLALNNIQTPLLWLACFTFLVRGWRRGRLLDFGLAGLAAGASLHFYFGSRLIPVLLLAIVLGLGAADPQGLRRRLPHLGILAAGFILAAAPLAATFSVDPFAFVRRGVEASVLADPSRLLAFHDTQSYGLALLYHLNVGTLGFFVPHLTEFSTFYWTGEPFISPFVAPLGLLGLGLATARWRRPEYLIVALWFWAVFVAGELLTAKIPYATTIVPLLPAISILAALSVSEVLEAIYTAIVGMRAHEEVGASLTRSQSSLMTETCQATTAAPVSVEALRTPSTRRRAATALVAAATLVLVAATAWDQLTGYFVRYASTYPWIVSTMQGQYAARWKADHLVFIAGAPRMYFRHGSTQFLALGVEGGDLDDAAKDIPATLPPGKGLAVIVYPHRRRVLPYLRGRYPRGVEETVDSPLGGPAFITFVVDPDDRGAPGPS